MIEFLQRPTWCLGLALLPLYSNQPIDLFCKSMGQFLCNGNTGMNCQSGWMVKVNVNLQIFLILSCLKNNIKPKLGRCVHTAFQTRRMQRCCYLVMRIIGPGGVVSSAFEVYLHNLLLICLPLHHSQRFYPISSLLYVWNLWISIAISITPHGHFKLLAKTPWSFFANLWNPLL